MTIAQNPTARTAEEWNYHPLKERLTQAAIGIGTGVAFAAALTQIFNPVAAGAAAAYGIGLVGYSQGIIAFKRKEVIASKIKEGRFIPVSPNGSFQKLVDKYASLLKIKPHTAYLVDERMVKSSIPWYQRWVLLIPGAMEKILPHVAGAATSIDAVIATPEFFKKNEANHVNFAMAHELSHAKTEDSSNTHTLIKMMKKHTVRALTVGIAASAAAGFLGIAGIPALTVGGLSLLKAGGLLFLAAKTSTLAINYADRIDERRADRNAVFLTRDSQSGIDFLDAAEDNKIPVPKAAWREWSSHPSYFPRVENLRAAFDEAQKYPELSTTVTPAIVKKMAGIYLEP